MRDSVSNNSARKDPASKVKEYLATWTKQGERPVTVSFEWGETAGSIAGESGVVAFNDEAGRQLASTGHSITIDGVHAENDLIVGRDPGGHRFWMEADEFLRFWNGDYIIKR